MLTLIPKFEALGFLKAKQTLSNKLKPNELNEIINRVYVIFNQNYFSYDEQLYSQNDG